MLEEALSSTLGSDIPSEALALQEAADKLRVEATMCLHKSKLLLKEYNKARAAAFDAQVRLIRRLSRILPCVGFLSPALFTSSFL